MRKAGQEEGTVLWGWWVQLLLPVAHLAISICRAHKIAGSSSKTKPFSCEMCGGTFSQSSRTCS